MYKKSIHGLLMATTLAALFGCGSWKDEDRMTKFSDSFRIYSKHLRWGHFHEVSSFMTPEHVESAIAAIPSLKGVRITAIKPLKWTVDKSQDNISGNIQIDYYIEDIGIVKQTSQPQTWRWFKDLKTWKLDADLPAF